jgi:hypothetical protein
VPASLLQPIEQQSLFATCPGGLCVPDPIIATAGNYIPPSCDPFPGSGAPGRCLSSCLPSIAAQPSLAQSTCATGDLCAPCFDPYTGASTGACTTSCDTPPTSPFTFPGCCDDGTGTLTGTCVPTSQVPVSLQSELTQSGNGNSVSCPGSSAAYLCVPDEYLPGGTPSTCTTSGFPGVPGACVSLCLNIGTLSLLGQADCPAHHVCVPCSVQPTTPGCGG